MLRRQLYSSSSVSCAPWQGGVRLDPLPRGATKVDESISTCGAIKSSARQPAAIGTADGRSSKGGRGGVAFILGLVPLSEERTPPEASAKERLNTVLIDRTQALSEFPHSRDEGISLGAG